MIIDCHCHIYPQKIADKAVNAIGRFYDISMDLDGTTDTLLKVGCEAGVTHFLVHSVATSPHQVVGVNEFVAGEVAAHPDKLIGFGSLHPLSENIEGDFAHLLELNLKGVKLHPDFLGMTIDDPHFNDIYELCECYGLPICFHTGDKRYDYSNPNRLKPLLKRFPKLKVIGAHFAGYSVWEDAVKTLPGTENLYVDCSSSFPFLEPADAKRILRAFGAERVLFGTDFPMWMPDKELEYLSNLGLTDDELEMIHYKNAARLLGLEEGEDK